MGSVEYPGVVLSLLVQLRGPMASREAIKTEEWPLYWRRDPWLGWEPIGKINRPSGIAKSPWGSVEAPGVNFIPLGQLRSLMASWEANWRAERLLSDHRDPLLDWGINLHENMPDWYLGNFPEFGIFSGSSPDKQKLLKQSIISKS
jgi:hypothetical protein